MSLQLNRPSLEALRAALAKAEAEPGEETLSRAELKRILRERIAELESVVRLVDVR
jgi:hypothetical protein